MNSTMIKQYDNDFFIRPAGNTDIPSVKNVVFSVLKEYGLKPDEAGKDNDLDDIETSFFANNGHFGVLVEKNTNNLIGTVGLFSLDKGTCELRKMYLLKDFRGKGLGKFMLTFTIQAAKERQYKRIVLETISPLKEAISLYKQAGFREIKPHEINERVDQAFELIL